MTNVFKQAEKDVKKFKSQHIAPAVLIEQMPKFKAEYEQAVEDYRKTEAYKLWLVKQVKKAVAQSVYDTFDDVGFRTIIRKRVTDEVLKELDNGNK